MAHKTIASDRSIESKIEEYVDDADADGYSVQQDEDETMFFPDHGDVVRLTLHWDADFVANIPQIVCLDCHSSVNLDEDRNRPHHLGAQDCNTGDAQ